MKYLAVQAEQHLRYRDAVRRPRVHQPEQRLGRAIHRARGELEVVGPPVGTKPDGQSVGDVGAFQYDIGEAVGALEVAADEVLEGRH